MRWPTILVCLATLAAGCGGSTRSAPRATTPAATQSTAAAAATHPPAKPRPRPKPKSTNTTAAHTTTTATVPTSRRITLPGPGFKPTPQEVAKAKQALSQCRQEDPGVTLTQLEKEASTPVGIQC